MTCTHDEAAAGRESRLVLGGIQRALEIESYIILSKAYQRGRVNAAVSCRALYRAREACRPARVVDSETGVDCRVLTQ